MSTKTTFKTLTPLTQNLTRTRELILTVLFKIRHDYSTIGPNGFRTVHGHTDTKFVQDEVLLIVTHYVYQNLKLKIFVWNSGNGKNTMFPRDLNKFSSESK